MRLSIEVEQEEDGRWLSEVIGLPGAGRRVAAGLLGGRVTEVA